MIRLSNVNIGVQDYREVFSTLHSRKLSQGKKVFEFEEIFASFINHEKTKCVALNSGTSALYVALLAMGIKKGDQVLLPSFSFAATANAVKLVGAEPVFCDIDPKTFTISIKEITKKITKKTRCVIPVHIFGLPADLPQIYRIAKKHNLLVIEDAAQAHGAKILENVIGWKADASVYSFYPTKNVTSVEGGLIAFKNPRHAEFARLFINQGMKEKYRHEIVGMNLRMSDVHASIGVAQIRRIQKILNARKKNAAYYRENLSPNYTAQVQPDGFTHAYHQYVIRINANRDRLRNQLAEMGIETGIYYPVPIHLLAPYKSNLKLPVTEKLCREILAIPVHNKLKLRDLKKVVGSLNSLADFYKYR